jgi:flagellar hook-associated protein 2
VLNLSTDATNGTAQDTELEYNGIPIKSSSTTISGAIPGLTLNLLKTGSSKVTVSDDDSSLTTKINAVVDAFNKFNDFVQEQFALPTDSAARSPLSTDPLLRSLNRQIRSYLTSDHANTGNIQNLTAIGIKLKQNGKLEVDKAALEKALSSDPDSVKTLLSGETGLAAKVSNAIESMTGSIDNIESRIKTTIDNYAERINTMEVQLLLRENTLIRQFAAADQAISQLNAQGNALNQVGTQYRLF